MFDKIGEKLKAVATVVCFIGIIGFIALGCILISQEQAVIGVVIMVLGSVLSWVASLGMYGFGELIEKVVSIEEHVNNKKIILEKEEDESSTDVKTFVVKDIAQEAKEETIKVKTHIGKCQMCDRDDVEVVKAIIKDSMGTRHREVCADCFKEYNCKPE